MNMSGSSISASPPTRESLSWFKERRSRWQQAPRKKVVSLTSPKATQDDDNNNSTEKANNATSSSFSFTKGNNNVVAFAAAPQAFSKSSTLLSASTSTSTIQSTSPFSFGSTSTTFMNHQSQQPTQQQGMTTFGSQPTTTTTSSNLFGGSSSTFQSVPSVSKTSAFQPLATATTTTSSLAPSSSSSMTTTTTTRAKKIATRSSQTNKPANQEKINPFANISLVPSSQSTAGVSSSLSFSSSLTTTTTATSTTNEQKVAEPSPKFTFGSTNSSFSSTSQKSGLFSSSGFNLAPKSTDGKPFQSPFGTTTSSISTLPTLSFGSQLSTPTTTTSTTAATTTAATVPLFGTTSAPTSTSTRTLISATKGKTKSTTASSSSSSQPKVNPFANISLTPSSAVPKANNDAKTTETANPVPAPQTASAPAPALGFSFGSTTNATLQNDTTANTIPLFGASSTPTSTRTLISASKRNKSTTASSSSSSSSQPKVNPFANISLTPSSTVPKVNDDAKTTETANSVPAVQTAPAPAPALGFSFGSTTNATLQNDTTANKFPLFGASSAPTSTRTLISASKRSKSTTAPSSSSSQPKVNPFANISLTPSTAPKVNYDSKTTETANTAEPSPQTASVPASGFSFGSTSTKNGGTPALPNSNVQSSPTTADEKPAQFIFGGTTKPASTLNFGSTFGNGITAPANTNPFGGGGLFSTKTLGTEPTSTENSNTEASQPKSNPFGGTSLFSSTTTSNTSNNTTFGSQSKPNPFGGTSIFGNTKPDEKSSLATDGTAVTPLPKTNLFGGTSIFSTTKSDVKTSLVTDGTAATPQPNPNPFSGTSIFSTKASDTKTTLAANSNAGTPLPKANLFGGTNIFSSMGSDGNNIFASSSSTVTATQPKSNPFGGANLFGASDGVKKESGDKPLFGNTSLSNDATKEKAKPTLFGGSNAFSAQTSSFANPSPFGAKSEQPPTPTFWGAAMSSSSPSPFVKSTSGTKDPDYRTRLLEFYKEHNPEKIDTVDATLEKFKGSEQDLFRKLEAKYGVSSFPAPTGSGPTCFLEFAIDDENIGRVVVKLFQDKTPLTVENFRCLCTGEKGTGRSTKPLCYKYSKVHRIVPGFCVQLGDFTKGDGTGGESIYPPKSEHGDAWGKFKDEMFMRHSKKGLLSMANSGANTNSSQFFVTLKAVPYLDGKHVVFGEVIDGFEVIEKIAAVETNKKSFPMVPVVVTDCGEITN